MGTRRYVTFWGGGGGADNWHIIHHKFSIHIQANVISHRLGYVTIFFWGGVNNWY